jgi:hypothetical protein
LAPVGSPLDVLSPQESRTVPINFVKISIGTPFVQTQIALY